eukprot:812728-Karenia_brevis.AAC.1
MFQQNVKTPELFGWLSRFQALLLSGIPSKDFHSKGGSNILGIERVGTKMLRESKYVVLAEDKAP